VFLVVPAAIVAAPLVNAAEFRGISDAFEDACGALGSRAAVVIVDQGQRSTGMEFTQGFRSFCGVPSAAVLLDDSEERAALGDMREADHGQWQLYVVSRDREAVEAATAATPRRLLTAEFEVVEATLERDYGLNVSFEETAGASQTHRNWPRTAKRPWLSGRSWQDQWWSSRSGIRAWKFDHREVRQ
jgi:hypothetical protein